MAKNNKRAPKTNKPKRTLKEKRAAKKLKKSDEAGPALGIPKPIP